MKRAVAWGAPVGAAGAVAFLAGGVGGDSYRFVAAGRTLLSTHWSYAFASKYIQSGPLQLALFGSVGRSGVALAVLLAVATTALLLRSAAAVGVRSGTLLATLGLLGVAVGVTRVGYEWGHPADAMLPLIWILSAVYARSGRIELAGILVGLSASVETWGILGVAVLALAPQWRDVGRGLLAAAAVPLVLFLPFVVGGHFAMASYVWPVRHPSFVSLFLANGYAFGWPLRLLQGAVALGAGIATARLLRESPHAPWVVPLAVVAGRLLLDPLFLSYYRPAVEGPILIGAALVASRVSSLRRHEESFA